MQIKLCIMYTSWKLGKCWFHCYQTLKCCCYQKSRRNLMIYSNPSSELHNRWRQYQLHFWTTGISLLVKTELKTIQTLSTNNDTKPLQCHSMAASQTYYYPCPEIGLNQKNTGCKMRERARASSWRMLEEKRQFRGSSGSYSFQVRWTYIPLKTCRVYYIGR
jgi:hypothetical protein